MKKLLAASLLIYLVTLSAMNSGGEAPTSRTFTNTTNKSCFIFIVDPHECYRKTLKPNTPTTIDYYGSREVVVGQTSIKRNNPKRNFIIKKDRYGGLRIDAE